MTRVRVQPQAWMGRGIHRVAAALTKYAPKGVEVVTEPEAAELDVIHVVGCGSLPADLRFARPYAIVQYCYRTTERPTLDYWLPVWRRARAVWSYYRLPGHEEFPLLHQPLGVDPGVFHEHNNGHGSRQYGIATHGYVAETEAVHECHRGAARAGKTGAHLGPNLGQGGDTFQDLSEDDVAALWSRSERVAALRRVEGFELPGVEGLLCGARPVAFDAPHYREWLGEHADYVPEVAPKVLTRLLGELFATPPRPVPKSERRAVARQFSWPVLARRFWEAVL
jgi:glycosyltransferase involved in cell wall biosynthesis